MRSWRESALGLLAAVLVGCGGTVARGFRVKCRELWSVPTRNASAIQIGHEAGLVQLAVDHKVASALVGRRVLLFLATDCSEVFRFEWVV